MQGIRSQPPFPRTARKLTIAPPAQSKSAPCGRMLTTGAIRSSLIVRYATLRLPTPVDHNRQDHSALIVPTLCVGMPTHRSAVTARPCQPGSQDCMQHDQINGIHQRHGIKTSAWPDCTTAHRRAVAPAFPRRAWERSNRVSRARRSRNNGAKRNCAGQTPLTHAARKPIFALLAQSSIAP